MKDKAIAAGIKKTIKELNVWLTLAKEAGLNAMVTKQWMVDEKSDSVFVAKITKTEEL